MNELLAAALRMMAPADRTPADEGHDDSRTALPIAVPYAEYVRRFEAGTDPLAAVTRASAVAHLVRLHRTIETLNGFARARIALDSHTLYQAHGDPRD